MTLSGKGHNIYGISASRDAGKNYRQVICLIPIDDMGVGDKRQPRLRA